MAKRVRNINDIKDLLTENGKKVENVLSNEFRAFGIYSDNKCVSMGVVAYTKDFGRTLCGVFDVYTMIDYRGNGYARKVMNAIIKDVKRESKKAGYPIHIYLTTNSTRKVAIKLYQSLGFNQIGQAIGKMGTNTFKLIIE